MLSTRNIKTKPLNPTNGSWWIVQILSKEGSEVSTHCRGWDYIGFRGVCRKDLKRTTHCRGWDYIGFRDDVCRKDLKRTTHCRGWDSAVQFVLVVCAFAMLAPLARAQA